MFVSPLLEQPAKRKSIYYGWVIVVVGFLAGRGKGPGVKAFLAAFVVGAAVAVATTRVLLGVHWFTDTVGGLLVGAGAALLVWALFAVPLERERLAWIARVSERNAARAQAHITPPER